MGYIICNEILRHSRFYLHIRRLPCTKRFIFIRRLFAISIKAAGWSFHLKIMEQTRRPDCVEWARRDLFAEFSRSHGASRILCAHATRSVDHSEADEIEWPGVGESHCRKSVLSILHRLAEVYAEMSVHGSGIGFIPETSHCGCAGEIQWNMFKRSGLHAGTSERKDGNVRKRGKWSV